MAYILNFMVQMAVGSQEALLSIANQWTQLASSSAWPPHDGAGLFSLNGTLFMIGGWSPPTIAPPYTHNQVWKSVNGGVTWTQLANAPWQARHTAGWQVLNGKIWVIGGDVNSGNYQRDVWTGTPNGSGGLDWLQITANATPLSMGRCQHITFAHNNKL